MCVAEKEGKIQVGWLDRVLYSGPAVEYKSSHTVQSVIGSDHSTKVFDFTVHAKPVTAEEPLGAQTLVQDTGGGNEDGDDPIILLEEFFATEDKLIALHNPGTVNGPGLTAQTTAVQTNPVPAVDTSSTGVQTGGALVSDTVSTP